MTCAGPAPEFDTVILAGGNAARMGGTDKPSLQVGGVPLLVLVAQAAAAAGTRRVIIVGPPRPGAVQAALAGLAAGQSAWLSCVREDPPGRGPVAGLRRGLAEVSAPWVVLLAADLPFLTSVHLTALLAAARSAPTASAPTASAPTASATAGSAITAGSVLADTDDRPQWLASCWPTDSLRSVLASYDGESLHGLLEPLCPALARLDTSGGAMPPWQDCDTPDDLAAARRAWRAHYAEAGDGNSR